MSLVSRSSSLIILLAATVSLSPAIPTPCPTQLRTNAQKRFWVAGLYDGNRVIVYFDAVTFNGALPENAKRLTPVADGFFDPVEVSASFIGTLERPPNSEKFALGDQYDLFLGNGAITTVTLTTLVGCETDEGVGNDSFVGALATVTGRSTLILTKGYYALSHHDANAQRQTPGHNQRRYAQLLENPPPFDLQRRIVSLLDERMKASGLDPQAIRGVSPEVAIQTFHVADGSVRYYARALWRSPSGKSDFALGAWVAPSPTVHVLAVEPHTAGYSDFLPALRNVVDLGDNRTGLIVSISRGETISLDLVEYEDGRDVQHMPNLQSISFGE